MVRRKQTRESWTQTDAPCTTPIVLLNRLSLAALRKHPEASESSLTIRNPSLMTGPAKQAVSRAPRNYRFFARPITNNERANSTLVEPNTNEGLVPKKRVRFNRPGPLCSKRENMGVPVTRCDMETEVSPVDCCELNLDTVIEHTELSELRGWSEVVVEQSSERQIGLPPDKKESTLKSYVSFSGAPEGGSSERKAPEESAEEKKEWASSGKKVLIRANVVHIYNHFYNGV